MKETVHSSVSEDRHGVIGVRQNHTRQPAEVASQRLPPMTKNLTKLLDGTFVVRRANPLMRTPLMRTPI